MFGSGSTSPEFVYVGAGSAEAGAPSHTDGADGVQPGSRAEEDEADPR